MKPVLLDFTLPLLGEVSFPAYFTLLAIGFALAAWITVREAPKLGLDGGLVYDLNLWMVAWGLIGSRILHLFADGHLHDYINLCFDPTLVPAIDAKVQSCTTDAMCGYDYLCNLATHKCYPPKDCLAALKLWRGGFAYYGGFLASVAYAYYFVRKHKMGWWKVADLAAPGIMLGLFFGRLGCYWNGCCYGKVTTSALGVVFPRGSSIWRTQYDAHLIRASAEALPVHATQLYESVLCFLIFLFLYYYVRPKRRAYGQVIAAMLVLYAVARSACEIFRDDDRGVFFGFLSTSQIISIPLFIAGVILWVQLTRARARTQPPSPASP